MTSGRHQISRPDALRLVYRSRAARLLPVDGWLFDATAIQQILDQSGTSALRIYLAIDDNNCPTLVLLGVDAQGRDQHEGEIAEYGLPCPPACDDQSPFQQNP